MRQDRQQATSKSRGGHAREHERKEALERKVGGDEAEESSNMRVGRTVPSNSPLYKPSRIFRASSECPTSSKASVASFPAERVDKSGEGDGNQRQSTGRGGSARTARKRQERERTSLADDDLVSCSRSNGKATRVSLPSQF